MSVGGYCSDITAKHVEIRDAIVRSDVSESNVTDMFCTMKAYNRDKAMFGGLYAPCQTMIDLCYKCEEIFIQNFDKYSSHSGIKKMVHDISVVVFYGLAYGSRFVH